MNRRIRKISRRDAELAEATEKSNEGGGKISRNGLKRTQRRNGMDFSEGHQETIESVTNAKLADVSTDQEPITNDED